MSLFRRDAKPAPAVQPRPAVRYAQLAEEQPAPAKKVERRGKAIIGAQVPKEISDLVDAKVEAGEFRSRSDFTLSAIRYYLEYLERKRR